jgi:hypothetical protein
MELHSNLLTLNTKFQGVGKTFDVMCNHVDDFEMNLKIFERDMEYDISKYFPNEKKRNIYLKINENPGMEKLSKQFFNIIEATVEQFSSRLMQFRKFEEAAKFI